VLAPYVHSEFLKFLRTIDREVPDSLQVHLILDNYATHTHPCYDLRPYVREACSRMPEVRANADMPCRPQGNGSPRAPSAEACKEPQLSRCARTSSTMPADPPTQKRRPSARLRVARAVCATLPPLVSQRVRDYLYPQSLAQREHHEFTIRSVTGSPFSGATSDQVAYPFAVHGYFNWRNVAIARAVCNPGAVILDVGANIGSETVGFSDIVGKRGAVYAFEPYPPNLKLLRRNAEQTRSQNVTVFPQALSDQAGDVAFSSPARENSGSGHVRELEPSEEPGDPAIVRVARTTLDSLQTQLRSPRLIVMDVEGHELAVLRGAEQLLAAAQPVIVLEVLEELLARNGTSPSMIADHLRRFDYELYEIGRFSLTTIESEQVSVPSASDWLAVPAPDPELIVRIRRTVRRSGFMPCVRALNPLCGRRP
jgi:FkbM family methyltransferase